MTRVASPRLAESPDLQVRFPGAQIASARWPDAMAELLAARVDDAGPEPLEEIFRLD
jgi:hypothetical protein